jgi:exopolysaccharide production protein ExoZ
MEAQTKGGGRLRSLQAGRGLAAVAVAVHHAAYATEQLVAPLPNWLAAIFHQGLLGVDFFFVLSGFIILNAHFNDPPTRAALNSYVWKRVIRVFVPYLPITLVLIAAYMALPELTRNNRDWGWLTSLLLVPSPYPPALAAAWTLVHEMLFYAIFIVYFLGRRSFIAAILAWTAAMLLFPAGVVDGQDAEPLMEALLNPINLEFCFGLGCAIGYRVISPRFASRLILLGIGIAAVFFAALGERERIVFGAGVAFLVLGFALQEKGLGLHIPAIPVFLGDASYAIYLIHVPVISLVVRLGHHLPFLANWPASLLLSACSAIAFGCMYYRVYERPALAMARRMALAKVADRGAVELSI